MFSGLTVYSTLTALTLTYLTLTYLTQQPRLLGIGLLLHFCSHHLVGFYTSLSSSLLVIWSFLSV